MFRVVNWEKAGDEEMVAGLTAEQAARKRLELAGYNYEFRMVGEYLTLFLSERRATLSAPAGRLFSVRTATYKDRRIAERQLCEWIIDAPLGGPYIVVTDREYEEAQKSMAADVHLVANERSEKLCSSEAPETIQALKEQTISPNDWPT